MNTLAPLRLMLHNEVRLSWRQMTARFSPAGMTITIVALLVLMHLFALSLPLAASEMQWITRQDVLAAVTSMGLFVFMMMLSLALISAVKIIYTRDDMDLLLSSPVPRQAIVVVRVLTIAIGLFITSALFIMPFANMMAVFGYPRFLLAYVVLLCLALTATSAGVLMAQGMFRLLGARRTRLFAQIFAGVLGLGFVLLVNMHNILPSSAKNSALQTLTELLSHVPPPDSWVWLPARAAIGEPLPFAIAVVLCLGLFLATTLGMANRMIANAVAANASNTVKTRSSRALTAQSGPIGLMRRKEWILIGRDPWLMSQIVMQLLMVVPCIFLVAKSPAGVHSAWLAVVFLSGQLAGMLAWLTMSTEEAPDLLATAPLSRREVALAKLQAALVPTAIIAALPVLASTYLDPWLGFTILICSTGSALTVSLLHVCNPTTGKRSDLSWRGQTNRMLAITEGLLGLMWVVFAALMVFLGWYGMPALLLAIPVIYGIVKRRRPQPVLAAAPAH